MYHSAFELGHVALNVKNLLLQSKYYQQVLGMNIITQTDKIVDLGVGNKILVRLIKTDQEGSPSDSYGLYHFAIVLPSREDLGQIFKHFIDNKIPLIGASDHGYSEAIYLEDVEGNGIEIYRDLPQDAWDTRDDGTIVGKTEAMDAIAIYTLGKVTDEPYQMPLESRMGHVHLSVKSSKVASQFYQETLSVSDKFSISSASWLASGDYHHHLAVNEWGGKNLQTRINGRPGLAYYTITFSNSTAYETIIKHIEQIGLTLQLAEHGVSFTDEDGITTRLVLDV